jgi:hypothetical protein
MVRISSSENGKEGAVSDTVDPDTGDEEVSITMKRGTGRRVASQRRSRVIMDAGGYKRDKGGGANRLDRGEVV